MRQITYCEAINEALIQEMERDSSVIVYGIGTPDHKRVFGTTNELAERFGDRCFDVPLSEDAMLGFGVGAAIGGLRPVNVHVRMDFLILAMNQLVTIASTHHYITGQSVPLVIRVIVGRGWGQGCHHSKTLHSTFAHIPGLKVVLPVAPYDAKGMMIAAIRDNNPVIMIEHRWLYWGKGEVPEESYTVPLDTARIVRYGKHMTIVATSWMVIEALHAADILAKRGFSAEVIDVRSATSIDLDCIALSVARTGYCVVADNDWVHCGLGSEIAAQVYDLCYSKLLGAIKRIGFCATPCPTVRCLENAFYPNAKTIIREVEKMLSLPEVNLSREDFYSHERRFKGPF